MIFLREMRIKPACRSVSGWFDGEAPNSEDPFNWFFAGGALECRHAFERHQVVPEFSSPGGVILKETSSAGCQKVEFVFNVFVTVNRTPPLTSKPIQATIRGKPTQKSQLASVSHRLSWHCRSRRGRWFPLTLPTMEDDSMVWDLLPFWRSVFPNVLGDVNQAARKAHVLVPCINTRTRGPQAGRLPPCCHGPALAHGFAA